jgi:4'-phosphopantetheinyl transferase
MHMTPAGEPLAVLHDWRSVELTPDLEPGQLHLWRIDATPFEAADHLATQLPPQERRRATQLRLEAHRRRYLITQTALRKILASYSSTHPNQIVFQRGKHGKPYLEGQHPRLDFNLSTTDNLVLLALARGQELGIDCERMRPRSQMEAIAQKMLPAAESEALPRLSPEERLLRFHQLWTRLEAQVKATGLGLYVDRDLSITTARHTQSFLPAPGFVATLASREPLAPIESWLTLQPPPPNPQPARPPASPSD